MARAVVWKMETLTMTKGTPCTCAERPMCQWLNCDRPAWVFSLLRPLWGEPAGRVRFICERCIRDYLALCARRIPGLDRPEGADDFWRPSIVEMVRLAFISEAFENRKRHERAGSQLILTRRQERLTTPQLQTLNRLHDLQSEFSR
jgi:hypothetical protein